MVYSKVPRSTDEKARPQKTIIDLLRNQWTRFPHAFTWSNKATISGELHTSLLLFASEGKKTKRKRVDELSLGPRRIFLHRIVPPFALGRPSEKSIHASIKTINCPFIAFANLRDVD